MNYTLFTVEEENLICVFDMSSRNTLMSGISEAIPEFDEPEMQEIAVSALRKLEAMTEAEFSAYIFSPAYHSEETEV